MGGREEEKLIKMDATGLSLTFLFRTEQPLRV